MHKGFKMYNKYFLFLALFMSGNLFGGTNWSSDKIVSTHKSKKNSDVVMYDYTVEGTFTAIEQRAAANIFITVGSSKPEIDRPAPNIPRFDPYVREPPIDSQCRAVGELPVTHWSNIPKVRKTRLQALFSQWSGLAGGP